MFKKNKCPTGIEHATQIVDSERFIHQANVTTVFLDDNKLCYSLGYMPMHIVCKRSVKCVIVTVCKLCLMQAYCFRCSMLQKHQNIHYRQIYMSSAKMYRIRHQVLAGGKGVQFCRDVLVQFSELLQRCSSFVHRPVLNVEAFTDHNK